MNFLSGMGNFESDHATAISVASRNLYSSISRSRIQRQPSSGSVASLIRFVHRQNSASKSSSPKIEKTTSSQQMLQEDEQQNQTSITNSNDNSNNQGAGVDMVEEEASEDRKKNNIEAEEEKEKDKERVVRNCGKVQRMSGLSPVKKTMMIQLQTQKDTKLYEYDDADDCNSTVASSSVTGESSTLFSFSPQKLVLENPNEFLNEEDLSSILAAYFVKMATDGNSTIARTGVAPRDLFSGSSVPQISILDYTKRMMRYLTGIAKSEYESGRDFYIVNDMAVRYMVMAIIYLERVKSKSKFIVSSKNIHRLIITAVTVASKIADDIQPKNSYFAKLGGIPMNELNLLENEFCSLIGFHLFIKPEEFKSRYESIIQSNRLNHTWSLSQSDLDRSTYVSSPVASIAAPAA